MNRFQKITSFLSKAEIAFFSLLWLMVLLVWGTVSQKWLGLYLAKHKFFSSILIWVGWIPLPGGGLTMGVITLGLLCKLFFRTKWNLKTLGINLIHIGALSLLLSGFLVSLWSEEGQMVIAEGGRSHVVSDYYDFEFVVTEKGKKQDQVVTFSQKWLQGGKTLRFRTWPFQVKIKHFYKNVGIQKRSTPASSAYRGFLKLFQLIALRPEKEAQQNRVGIQFKIKGVKGKEGLYGIYSGMEIPQTLKLSNGKVFVFHIRKKQTFLPFAIELLDFQKKLYPGTRMAESYQSQVAVLDGNLKERVMIRMNHPLRYKGYTFYQASYIEGTTETTVLAVVRNQGQLLPYLSSLLLCLGLLFHVLFRARENFARSKRGSL